MARARNIKPSFFQNDQLAELPPLARLLFIGLWTIADFKGCLEMRPKKIKAQLLPYDNCCADELLRTLDKSGFISIYSVQGHPMVKIPNFNKHQNPHKNERESGSDLPDIDKKDSEISWLTQDGTTLDKNGTDPADSLLLIPDSPILIPPSTNGAAAPVAVERRGEILDAVCEQGLPAGVIAKQAAKPRGDAGADVRSVFTYWQAQRGHDRAKLDDKRAKAIRARLTDGYSAEDLCKAVDGIAKSSHHMGQNDTRTVYDDIELICRSAANVDKFIKLATEGNAGGGLQRQGAILKDWI